MKAYFIVNTPYLYRINDKIANLLKIININELMVMINSLDEVNKKRWKTAFYEEFPEEEITIEIVKGMVKFIYKQSGSEYIQIPNICSLAKYKNKGINITEVIADFLLKEGEKKPYIVTNFFERILADEKIDEIIDFFEGDIQKLLMLYLISMEGNDFDYDGDLLLRLIQCDKACWNDITIKCGGIKECNINSSIFEKIWMLDNYCEMVNIAYNNLRDSYFHYLRHDTIIDMFASLEDEKLLVTERKELWISEYIEKHAFDELKIKDIFDVIATAFPKKRVKFIKEFLGKNSNVDVFKNLYLFPSSRSWSGSEVPLIEKDIDFLQDLLNEISGVDFLEHKLYLKKWISSKKKYKEKVLQQEYMESFTYV